MIDPAKDAPWPERRFSQAIAEGDGISIIPIIRGDVAALALAAEDSGAEAVLVESIADARTARAATRLPVVLRPRKPTRDILEEARAVGADGVALRASALGRGKASVYANAVALGFDCAVCVTDEEQLQGVLEAFEPEIVIAAPGARGNDATLASALDMLTDVPAGKLVIVETRGGSRNDVVSFERVGVDALVIEASREPEKLSRTVNALINAERPLD